MSWSHWHHHFRARAKRPLPRLERLGVPDEVRDALALSLAKFQLGEAGEGRIAHEIDQCTLPGVDADYRAALKLFVKEEGRHGRILGRMVKALGARPLRSTWTEGLFRKGRRLMGTRLKLVVLLSAEVVAVGFYGAIAEALPAGDVRDALEQIVADEDHHLGFHCAFFRLQTPEAWQKLAFLLTWWAVAGAACTVVLIDHRHTLRQLEIPLGSTAAELVRLIHSASLKAVGPQAIAPQAHQATLAA